MFRLPDWRNRAWLVRESRARTGRVLIGLPEAERTRERKDLRCWRPVRMRFPAEANGSALASGSLSHGKAGAPKLPPPQLTAATSRDSGL